MANTWVAAARIDSVTGLLVKLSKGALRVFNTLAVSRLQGVPFDAATPAELTA